MLLQTWDLKAKLLYLLFLAWFVFRFDVCLSFFWGRVWFWGLVFYRKKRIIFLFLDQPGIQRSPYLRWYSDQKHCWELSCCHSCPLCGWVTSLYLVLTLKLDLDVNYFVCCHACIMSLNIRNICLKMSFIF